MKQYLPFEGVDKLVEDRHSEQTIKEFDEVIHNSNVFKPLEIHQTLTESKEGEVVDWQKYHPTTEEEIEESYIKINAAPDYSSEPENYGK